MASKAKQPETMGSLIDGIWAKREAKRALEAQVETISKEIAAMEATLIERLDKEGTDKATGKKASVSISQTQVANIIDFEAFAAYVKKTGYFHLFQRRATDTACRELWEQGKSIPGLEAFTKRKLNVRTVA